MPSIEDRLKELGLELPAVTAPVATYVNAVRTGDLMFLSGKVPVDASGNFLKGKVGADVTTEEAARHARLVGLHLIAVLKHELGSLEKVRRVVKLLGMVNAVPEYGDQPKVINGCSDLFVEVFGDKGRHARSAVGVGSLPLGVTVEVEAIVEVG
jgi:enamine deaminase RidA (YjgF/YER057c/UK114 family)